MEEISKGIKIIKVLKQIMDNIRDSVKHQFREMDLTGPQGMMLGTLAHYGEMKISDLSEKLGISNSTVSGMVDRLEKQGLIERTRSEEDRRVVYVSVTSECRKKAKEQFRHFEKRFEDIMSTATPEELDIILEGLDTLKRIVDRENNIR